MKITILCVSLILLGAPGGWSQISEDWVIRYMGPGGVSDRPEAIGVDTLGNVYVTGWSVGSGTGFDFATIKYSSLGSQVWLSRYSHPENSSDRAYDLALDESGFVYVTGFSYRGVLTFTDYTTIKYFSSSGNSQWLSNYNWRSNTADEASAIDVDQSGNVYVTGASWDSTTGFDYATIKYDNTGDSTWISRYDGPRNDIDQARDIAVDNSGNVYVTGRSMGNGDEFDITTIKYDSNGGEDWVRSIDGPSNGEADANALEIDNSGNVYVTGKSWNGTNFDYATIKYSSTGTELWASVYNGTASGDDIANAVRRFSVGEDIGTDLALDDSGNVYVTGSGGGDYVTIKYSDIGDIIWTITYNGTGNDYDTATAIEVDPSGNVYVTGTSMGTTSWFDYVTIKYVPVILYHDYGVISLSAPPDTVFSDSTYTPMATVRNFGNSTADSFDVIATINGYADTQKVYSLPPFTSTSVSFQSWTVPSPDSTLYLFTACTYFPQDNNVLNDCDQKNIFAVTFNPVGVEEEENDEYRTRNIEFRLNQNHPNPFHKLTAISYQIPHTPLPDRQAGFNKGGQRGIPVKLEIYDLTGRLVEILVDEHQDPGVYQVEWDGKNQTTGMYIYRLKAGDNTSTRKLILLR
jgi:hypothetical protein